METVGDAVVVGAGPAGCVMTLYLLKRGFKVQLFERYPRLQQKFSDDNPEKRLYPAGDYRSFPMSLSARTFTALEGAGLEIPSTYFKQKIGGCTHLANGKKVRITYSNGKRSNSVSRNALVSFLQQSILERTGDNLSIHFGLELLELKNDIRTAYFAKRKKNVQNGDEEHDSKLAVQFDLLVGADGISSKVRSELIRLDEVENENSPMTIEFQKFPASYKSFYISPSNARASPLFEDNDRVQTWPALNMLISNVADESFWGGVTSPKLVNATSSSEVEKLFRENAPEVYKLLIKENPNFAEDFVKQQAVPFGGSLKLSRLHKDNVVLIGDAAHAMFPTYGTGCNAALEDCSIFDSILAELIPGNGSRGVPPIPLITSEFTKRRLEDVHAIVDINKTKRDKLELLKVVFYNTVHKWFPQLLGPMSTDLILTTVPFSEIKKKKQRENLFFYVVLGLFIAIILASFMVLKKLIFVK